MSEIRAFLFQNICIFVIYIVNYLQHRQLYYELVNNNILNWNAFTFSFHLRGLFYIINIASHLLR